MTIAVTHPTDRPNFSAVHVHELTIWFSYSTPIAFAIGGASPVVRRNSWSTTTGKHLNHVDGGGSAAKRRRVESDVFERELAAITVAMIPTADQLAASLIMAGR